MSNLENIYARWLAGELSHEELDHLQATGELAGLQELINSVDRLDIAPYNLSQQYEQVHQQLPKVAKTRKLNTKWLAYAAALALLLIAGYQFLFSKPTFLESPYGKNITHNFSDGSSIQLNDGSTASFDADNWENDRTVELDGEALFDVEKGAPFVVQTPYGSVTVLGTQFNVRARNDKLYVECYSGKVQVKAFDQSVYLIKSESVLILRSELIKDSVDNLLPLWTQNESKFKNAALTEVFEELERQYAIKVRANLATKRSFSGSFPHNDLTNALKSICDPLSLNFSISDDSVDIK